VIGCDQEHCSLIGEQRSPPPRSQRFGDFLRVLSPDSRELLEECVAIVVGTTH
jgi:hypothetical protein